VDSPAPIGILGSERGTFLLALVVLAAVAVLDVAIRGAVLVELLLAGPLVAAVGAGVRQTSVIAAVAFVLSVLLGWVSDVFGAPEHVGGMVAVAVGGGLSLVVAWLRTARERDAARLRAQYGAARVLAEARSLEQAAPRLLEAIGRPLGWELGHLWEGREDGALRRVGSWRAEQGAAPSSAGAATELLPGQGLPGEVWRTGRPAWRADPAANGALPSRKGSNPGSGYAFPVRAGDETLAVIELAGPEARTRDLDLTDVGKLLGVQVGEFIVGRRAAEAVRDSEARKSAMLDSALDGVITVDHEGRVIEFSAAAGRIFGHAPEAALGVDLAELAIPPSLRQRHRLAFRRCVETGEGRILGRRIELSGMRADGSEFPVELAISRVAGREPPIFTGVVRDITERRRTESERDELLRLEHLARLDATHARDQLEAILRGVADAVTAQAPDGRLLFANDAAVSELGYDSSEALLRAPPTEVMDRFEMLDEEGRAFPLSQLPGRRALADGEAAQAMVRYRRRDTGDERWSAVKSTPILDGDGAVVMAINVIEDITAHKRAEMASRFLAQSSAVLASSLDPHELVREIAALTVPELADWCTVHLRTEDGGIEQVALAHADPDRVGWAQEVQRRYPLDPGAPTGVPNVLRTGAAELYSEIPEALPRAGAVDEEHHRLLAELGMRSAIIAPLIAREQTIGTLTFVTGPSGRRFDEHDLDLARELALRCAAAIDNARLYSERAYIARTLQQSLLPAELPDIPGIETAARFRPAGEGNEVGGDFYDLFPTGDHAWTMVMGDVCGKGPDAAAVTALARYTLRAAAMRERLPSRSLGLLNEALLRQRDDRRFCTVAYAYFERLGDGARVGVASAGHPLPLLLHPDGTVAPIGEPGTLLGVVPDPRFVDRAVTLAPGDALVLYTDGVIESRGGTGSLDEESLAGLVASCGGRGADAIASTIEEAAMRSNDGRPRDDIAVLVLRLAG
jgi:PAS domain S-box-containing protein